MRLCRLVSNRFSRVVKNASQIRFTLLPLLGVLREEGATSLAWAAVPASVLAILSVSL